MEWESIIIFPSALDSVRTRSRRFSRGTLVNRRSRRNETWRYHTGIIIPVGVAASGDDVWRSEGEEPQSDEGKPPPTKLLLIIPRLAAIILTISINTNVNRFSTISLGRCLAIHLSALLGSRPAVNLQC